MEKWHILKPTPIAQQFNVHTLQIELTGYDLLANQHKQKISYNNSLLLKVLAGIAQSFDNMYS